MRNKSNLRLIYLFAATILLCFSVIALMFLQLIRRYEKDTALESAKHLIEINTQIESNIEKTIKNDRRLARTLASELNSHSFSDENAIFDFLVKTKNVWNVDSIYLYNYAGLCINEKRSIQSLGTASMLAYQTVKYGEMFNVSQSVVECSVAVKTNQRIHEQPIVAVSVARDLDTLIENMDISSFEGRSAVYLTQKDGVKISQTNTAGVRKVFNISALFTSGRLVNLTDKNMSFDNAMHSEKKTVFLYTDKKTELYVVICPVKTGKDMWYLFYIVPNSVVNKTMRSFSSYILLFMGLSGLFFSIILFIFFYIYQRKTIEYNNELQAREDDLRRALVLADSANKAKTSFLSNMSHDIRTPMNAIINMTQFTVNSIDDKTKSLAYLKVIKESSDHLLKLINDVLDMSRIESGRMSFSNDSFDFTADMNAVCSIIKPLCDTKNLVLEYQAEKIIHTKLKGDTTRLNRILINLLNNAVKFTPENGTITFKITEERSLNVETASFRFEVCDTGIGISQENLQKIFEPFTRADDSVVKQTEGSGLGLSISKRIVEAMGGTISVRSTVGKGSTFTVELFFPINTSVPEQKKDKPDKNISFEGKRALLVEDNEINSEIASMLLKQMGFAVDTAFDGTEAVQKYEIFGAHHYDIIYMDIQMQHMNGYDAARLIRSMKQEDAQKIPIIAMTANVFAEDIEKARKAGMNAHIAKPINPERLKHITFQMLSEVKEDTYLNE